MTDDNTHTIEIQTFRLGYGENPNLREAELTEQEVRELASQLPTNVLQEIIKEKYDEKIEATEQQKVSDCCGGEVGNDSPNETFDSFYCKYCGKPCDAVEPNDKIEKIKAITDRNLYDKINEIIEKINND